jgi:hypothetical protein
VANVLDTQRAGQFPTKIYAQFLQDLRTHNALARRPEMFDQLPGSLVLESSRAVVRI